MTIHPTGNFDAKIRDVGVRMMCVFSRIVKKTTHFILKKNIVVDSSFFISYSETKIPGTSISAIHEKKQYLIFFLIKD